jgi:hypothetical protein
VLVNDFEQEIRSALRRDPAPPDFAAKVLARVAEQEIPAKVIRLPVWRRPAAWAIAAGLSIAAIVPPVAIEYRQRREARALEARRELLIALEVTRTKLQQTRERIQRTTRLAL